MKELAAVLVVVTALWVWLDKNLFGQFSPAVRLGVFAVLAVVIIVAVSLLRAIGRGLMPGDGKRKNERKNTTRRAGAYMGRR
jgi:O-antigen/teichoic acid export membrane protein